jgi:hypothetical protein
LGMKRIDSLGNIVKTLKKHRLCKILESSGRGSFH